MNTVYSFAEKNPANTIVLITGSSGTGNPYPLMPVIRLRLNQKLNTNNNSLIRLWSETCTTSHVFLKCFRKVCCLVCCRYFYQLSFYKSNVVSHMYDILHSSRRCLERKSKT